LLIKAIGTGYAHNEHNVDDTSQSVEYRGLNCPEQISHPYQISEIERPTETNGKIFAVTDATIGVTTFVSIVVTD